MKPIDKAAFLKEYTAAVRDENAAMFVGAGISRAAGYVDWKGLLREIAEELDLDIDRETDLVALAQYHVNYRQGRDRLNQLLIDEFLEHVELTQSHHLIASLPIHTIWTTNYDDLIETAFTAAHKRTDIKRRRDDFAVNRRNSDVTIYKMHGDKTTPAEAILTKEDYETYDVARELFTIALKGDLTRKTFLFLGFGFEDPNVTYILGRVKRLLETNSRKHFCLVKEPTDDGSADGAYRVKRFGHWLTDLHRYNIQPIIINSYGEVSEILAELNRRSHLRDVFISGSAADFSPLGEDKFRELCKVLGSELIKKGYNIVSGFGVGVGDMVIVGAMQELRKNSEERLHLWPFPQSITGDRAPFWRQYREKMIANAGVCVILAGNKYNGGRIRPADGVRQEIDIAQSQGKHVIPVGATGHVAREQWEACRARPEQCFGKADLSGVIESLGDETASVDNLVKAVIDGLKLLDK